MKRPTPAGDGHGPRVVAVGGGHGLAVSLRALRRVTDNLTAVVGVSDDGGSSGRLRTDFGVLPPGDLRMALAALCDDDSWGQTWSRVVQHRFRGPGGLEGHSLGNLLIMALWEETGDVIAGLDWVAALLGAQGRVLPVSSVPLEIVAQVAGLHSGDPERITEVRGQVAVATTKGEVRGIAVDPTDPPACPETLAAVAGADVIVLGPGSWFTSVIAPLLVPDLARAIRASSATRVVVLNLEARPGEENGFTAEKYLSVLSATGGGLAVDAVIADPDSVADQARLHRLCAEELGAELILRPVAASTGPGVHDADLLAAAFGELVGRERSRTWH